MIIFEKRYKKGGWYIQNGDKKTKFALNNQKIIDYLKVRVNFEPNFVEYKIQKFNQNSIISNEDIKKIESSIFNCKEALCFFTAYKEAVDNGKQIKFAYNFIIK